MLQSIVPFHHSSPYNSQLVQSKLKWCMKWIIQRLALSTPYSWLYSLQGLPHLVLMKLGRSCLALTRLGLRMYCRRSPLAMKGSTTIGLPSLSNATPKMHKTFVWRKSFMMAASRRNSSTISCSSGLTIHNDQRHAAYRSSHNVQATQ